MTILEKFNIGYIAEGSKIKVLIDDVIKQLNMVVYNDKKYIRWNRVNKYLSEIGYDQKVYSNSYIPLNIFYRLVFMMNTEQAKTMKKEIADFLAIM